MSYPNMSPPPYWYEDPPLDQFSIPVSTPIGRCSWPPQHNNYFVSQESPLSFTDPHAPLLTDAALWFHTAKCEPCPSPSLSTSSRSTSQSPILSSVASVIDDDPVSKRRRVVPSVCSSFSASPGRVGRSLSPLEPKSRGARMSSSTGGTSASSSSRTSARYRAIRPAPPKREPSESDSIPSPQSPKRHAASAPASPYSRVAPLGAGAGAFGGAQSAPFAHTPTDLPPTRYAGGKDTPFRPEKLEGTIPGSMLDTLPLLEARFDRLEIAIGKYAEARVKKALRNSIIEGSEIEDTTSSN